ncbi:MAG: hypothetical protein AB8F95_19550 [Bacteroidia bacterium]
MKKISLLGTLLSMLLGITFGQTTLKERTIPVKTYDVRENGLYPSDVVEGPEEAMAMIQYWPTDNRHNAPNIYLQVHRLEDYSLRGQGAATELGHEGMEVREMRRLERSYAIIGRQYLPKEKRIVSVARFFDLEGKGHASDPVTISTYKGKPAKDLTEQTLLSPNKKCMLWEGRTTKTNKYYASAWNADGRVLWQASLEVPHQEKYSIAQTAVADDGGLFFLLTKTKTPTSLKDSLYPPLLVAYNSRSKTFSTDTIQIDSAYSNAAWLAILPSGEPVVAGVWSRGPSLKGIIQYGSEGDKHHWGGFFMQRSVLNNSKLERDTSWQDTMPSGWYEQYGIIGPHFGGFNLIVDKEKGRRVILVAEEISVSGDIIEHGRLGLVGFDPLNCHVVWESLMDKKQRDRGTDRFLSYVPMIAKGKLRLVYLSEMGAPGKIVAASFSLRDGKLTQEELADNFDSGYLFLPKHSGPVSENEMILIGLGNPSKSDFKFLKISF